MAEPTTEPGGGGGPGRAPVGAEPQRWAVLHSAAVLAGLQRTAGNAATAQLLQRAVAPSDQQSESSPVLDVVGKGGGHTLSTEVRADMENRLGDDFSDVRIHTDAKAADSAAAVSARAYTVGNEIVFADGSFDPANSEGRHTLAHELTHVSQQRSGPVSGHDTGTGIAVSDPTDSFELEAEEVASRALARPMAESADGGAQPGRDEERL